jgi:hypothetical protein
MHTEKYGSFGPRVLRLRELLASHDPSKADYVRQLGLHLSINDGDLTHEYVSKGNAMELSLPHFEIMEIHEKKS